MYLKNKKKIHSRRYTKCVGLILNYENLEGYINDFLFGGGGDCGLLIWNIERVY